LIALLWNHSTLHHQTIRLPTTIAAPTQYDQSITTQAQNTTATSFPRPCKERHVTKELPQNTSKYCKDIYQEFTTTPSIHRQIRQQDNM